MIRIFWIGVLFLSTTASATQPSWIFEQTPAAKEKPFYSVSNSDVLKSHCTRSIPFSEKEMSNWLESQARSDTRSVNANVFGIELVDESPYLIKLFEALLTNENWLSGPQKTYSSSCEKVYCAAQELFGDKVGTQLLFMLGRFGFNGSHLRIKNADLWKSEELDTVLLSLSDLPKHLISSTPVTYNHLLAHFKRSESAQPHGSEPIANAMIFVFDNWNRISLGSQRYAVFHELGHDTGGVLDLSDSPAWLQAAGWKDTDLEWQLAHPETAISQYAETNPFEDFAESFAAYRYNPETLKALNPTVYRFFKTKVFHNIEYTSEKDCR